MEMQNAKVVLPGASRSIGRTIARKLAAQGAILILPWFADWPDDAASLQEEFGGEDSPHLLLEVDLRDSSQVAGMAATIHQRFGSLEVLINNIERGGMPVVHGSYHKEVNKNQWQLEMETTLQAKWLLFDACLPLLQKADSAAVVNISSIAGLVGRSGPASYLFNDGFAAANRGIASMTETWARIGAPNIRVNELMLGLVDGRHGKDTRGWQLLPDAVKNELLEHTLLERTGTPEEVASAVLFLIRDAGFMSGSVLRLDGGYCLGAEKTAPLPKGIL